MGIYKGFRMEYGDKVKVGVSKDSPESLLERFFIGWTNKGNILVCDNKDILTKDQLFERNTFSVATYRYWRDV